MSETITVSLDELFKEYFPDFGVVDSGEELNSLLDIFHRSGIQLQESPAALQIHGRSLILSASEAILSTYGEILQEQNTQVLEQIEEGVIVVSNLIDAVPEITELLDFNIPKIITSFFELNPVKLRPIFDVHGAVIDPYNAFILDESLLKDQTLTPEGKQFIAAHEVWHVLGHNQLPMLLNEAFTDILANDSQSVVSTHDSRGRMGTNYTRAFDIAERCLDIAGKELFTQGYLEEAVTVTAPQGIRRKYDFYGLAGHPFHTQMNQVIVDNYGNSRWDEVLRLLSKKRVKRADRLFTSCLE